MALNFPDAPVNGQVFTVGALSWTYDGTKWLGTTGGGGGGGGGGALPAGTGSEVQYRLDGTTFGSDSTFIYNAGTDTLRVDNISTPAPAIIFTALGGQYGGASLEIGNNNGKNGAMFSTTTQQGVDLVDFVFKAPSAKQANIRFECRAASINGSNTFEMQVGNPTDPSINIGSNNIYVRRFVTLLADPTNGLHAATKQYVDTRVAKAGDTMTAPLTVAATGQWAHVTLNKTAAGTYASAVIGQRAGVNRWVVKVGDDTAESGSGNTGSDFLVERYNDAGTWLGASLSINRATGNAAFSGSVRATLFQPATDTATEIGQYGFVSTNGPKMVCYGVSAAGAGGVYYYAGNTEISHLSATGDLSIAGPIATKPGGGSWVAPSDVRLKESVEPYTRGLEALLQLQPVTYKYNGEADMPTDTRFHGLVADDVQPVMPEAVGRAIFGQRSAQNEDETDEPGKEYLTFDQTPLLFALVNAVKELAAQVAELRVLVRAPH